MKTDVDEIAVLNEITERIIGCAYRVSNALGTGFLEKVYENALAIELRKHGLSCEQQCPIKVWYDGQLVGEYLADLIVDSDVLVELKAISDLHEFHTAQCLNYLRATQKRLCLLFNFGQPRVQVRRIVLD